MIYVEKNFLFVHVPKTGGNSIQNILKDYSEDEIVNIAKNHDSVERFEVRNNKYSPSRCYEVQNFRFEATGNRQQATGNRE